MSGIEIQYFLGIYFTVVGFSNLLILPVPQKDRDIAIFISGMVLILMAIFGLSPIH